MISPYLTIIRLEYGTSLISGQVSSISASLYQCRFYMSPRHYGKGGVFLTRRQRRDEMGPRDVLRRTAELGDDLMY